MSRSKKKMIHKWTNPAFAKNKFTNKLWWELKCSSMDTIENVFDFFYMLNSSKKRALSENLFPKSYSQILAYQNSLDMSNDTIVHQLFFGCSIIKLYSKELNKYLEYKYLFETALIQNEYDECQEYIKKINNDISVSLWAIQNEILLGQLEGKLEGNKKALKRLRTKNLNRNVDILSGLYSFCVEEKVTTDGFENTLHEKFEKWGEKYSEVCSYFSFVLDKTSFDNINQIPSIIKFASSNSIIDFYENIVSLIILIFSKHKEDLINSRIKRLIKEIAKEVGDDRWFLLSNYINPNNLMVSTFHKDKLIPALELYSEEKYSELIPIAKKLIHEYPLCLDFYDIYCKALMSLNINEELLNDYLKITDEHTLINEIVLDCYNILRKSEQTSGSLSRLLKKAKMLSTSAFSDSLFSFCVRHSLTRKEIDTSTIYNQGVINGVGGTPKFSYLYPATKAKKIYIKKFEEEYGNLLCLRPYKFQIEKESSGGSLSSREKIYLAKILFSEGEYKETIKVLEELLETEFICFHRERVIRLLLQSYCINNNWEKELLLFSNTIVENHHFLHSVDMYNFFNRIKEISFQNSSLALDKSIFIDYFLKNSFENKQDNFERYSAYTDFLDSLGIHIPSELFSDSEKMEMFQSDKLKYFFKFVCCSETLEDDWHFENIIERENERIIICDYLTQIDSKNSDFYQKETLEISRTAEIRKFLRKIDKSRIFVETGKIISILDDNFKEKCERLLSLINLPQDLRQVKEFENGDIKQPIGNELGKYKDGALDIFQFLFRELAELFVLHDEYGLDSFLSGRIRHGVFDTEIRSVFEMNNLVTKSEDGEYIKNDFWLKDITDAKIISAFNILSEKVDEQLSYVIQNWIQVSTESPLKYIEQKNTGLLFLYNDRKVFDFSFSPVEIDKYYNELNDIQDVKEFCDYIFDILWKRANLCLKTMRTLIKEKLQNDLLKNLEVLEKETENEKRIDTKRLISNIHNCHGQLNRKLDEVSNWFRLSKTLTYENYKLENLLNSCISIFNNRNANHFLTSNISCNENRIYHAITFLPLIEILLIKLGNIVKHSPNEIQTTIINAVMKDGFVTISTQNDLSDGDINIGDLKLNVESALGTYDPTALRREGRTGFHKINNIIRNHFDPESTKFKCEIKDDQYFYSEIVIPEEVLLA